MYCSSTPASQPDHAELLLFLKGYNIINKMLKARISQRVRACSCESITFQPALILFENPVLKETAGNASSAAARMNGTVKGVFFYYYGIFLRKNDGYKWTELPEGCFRGYLQPPGDPRPLRSEEAVRYLARAESFARFQELLKETDGCFAIVLRRKDGSVWAAVDAARSMPLYYSRDGRFLSDSGPAVREALRLPKESADPAALEELFHALFIAGPRTAYAEIAQLDAGQALERTPSGELRTAYYYAHIQPIRDIGREEALELFQQVSDEAFDRIIAAIDGRPVVLSLSGGYDSRYIACMLKRRGVENVSCYTYGRKDSFETRQSEKVAKALGYRWACVEYTDERIMGILDNVGRDYTKANECYDYSSYFQNFPAVRFLHESGWIKPDSVFLTGLCNDMPTGYYEIALKARFSNRFSLGNFPEAVFPEGGLEKLSEMARKAAVSTIEEQRRGLSLSPADNYQRFASSVDSLWTIRDHSRQFLHMNDVHAFFGYEWIIPCWSRKLLEFWYSLPLEYRLDQNLYEEWITTRVPAQYGVGQKKTIVSYTAFRGWERTKARIRLLLRRMVYLPLGITMREKQDFNNFEPLTVEMFRRLCQKSRIYFRNASLLPILTLYMMEQCYGSNCLKS